jgi:hypothetical protein
MKTSDTKEAMPHDMPPFFEVKGDWQAQSIQLKSKFPFLTDGDLKLEAGRENEMLKSMEARLHMNRAEVVEIIEKNYQDGQ